MPSVVERDPMMDGVGKVGADGGGRGRTEGRDWEVWEGWSGGRGVVMGRLLLSTVTRKGGGVGMLLYILSNSLGKSPLLGGGGGRTNLSGFGGEEGRMDRDKEALTFHILWLPSVGVGARRLLKAMVYLPGSSARTRHGAPTYGPCAGNPCDVVQPWMGQ